MHKKIIKTKKVVTMYSTPAEEQADVVPMSNDYNTATTTASYGDHLCMDIPFFVRLLEHTLMKVSTAAELQILAEKVVDMSKTTPCLTLEDFQKLASSLMVA